MELLERFARGDVDAFETLFREHQGGVYGRVLCLVRDPAAAEDLTLECFWRIYRSHARFDPERSFGAWAQRIATNLALEHMRKAGREVLVDQDVLAAHAGASGGDHAERAGLRAAIRRAFAALPVKLKAVASLILLEEETYADAAAALGITVEAVKSREFRAVRQLRRNLAEMGMER